MTANPHWKSADEVIVPPNPGFGWAGSTDIERRLFDDLETQAPYAMRQKAAGEFNPDAIAQFDAFQESRGRYPGSRDWSLLDEFMAKKDLSWQPQIIGSCVWSNTQPRFVERCMIQIGLMQQAQEFLGRSEFGPDNFSPYGPYSYGIARRHVNMRGGDGLYCEAMVWALQQGFLPCNTPRLLELLKQLGVDSDKDFPEPQGNDGAKIYRRFGNWEFLDLLSPYADFPCTETPMVKSAAQLKQLILEGKPCFVCSNIAIRKVGNHKDGFPIHGRDPRNSWAHNMGFDGLWVASDGDEFFREPNTSWGPENIYNLPYSEVDSWFRNGLVTCAGVGNINLPMSAPPLI